TIRPFGRPPTPSAMSSPSEPLETVSTSMERSFLPSFITEPLPNWRSIWDSAADSALLLSMDEPSTIRSAVVADIGSCSLWRGFAWATNGWGKTALMETLYPICSQFAICSFEDGVRYIPFGHVTMSRGKHLPTSTSPRGRRQA